MRTYKGFKVLNDGSGGIVRLECNIGNQVYEIEIFADVLYITAVMEDNSLIEIKDIPMELWDCMEACNQLWEVRQ